MLQGEGVNLYIFCFTLSFHPLHTSNLNAIKAVGHSEVILRLEIIKKVIGLALILITMWISPLAMALGAAASSLINQVVNSWPNKKLLNYRYLEQIRDIFPNLAAAVAMAAIVFCIQLFGLQDWLTLLIQIPLGFAVYIGISKLFHMKSFPYVLGMVRRLLKKGNSELQGTE